MGKKRMQSPSSMNTYFQCPRKYFYQYKLRMPTSPSIHLVRGSVAHLALEKLYTILPEVIAENYKQNLQIIVKELLKKYWAESKDEFDKLDMHAQEIQGFYEETENMLIKFIDTFSEKLDAQIAKGMSFVDAFKALSPETEKEYLSWELYVKGFIDAIENVDGKVRLMDYKTSKRSVINDAYKLQLAIYALLYKVEHKKIPDEVGIYFLKDGVEKMLVVDEDLLKLAEFKIEQIHASTDSDDMVEYSKNQTPLCKWSTGQCDFYDYCFKGKDIPKEPLPSTWKKK